MNRRSWSLILVSLAWAAFPAWAQEPSSDRVETVPTSQRSRRGDAGGVGRPAPDAVDWAAIGSPSFSAVLLQDPFTTANDQADEDGTGASATRQRPKHIRDNAFLVEEAFNQERGEAQHIFNWIIQWNCTPAARTRDFAFAYTMELPLGGQKHQFSFTTQFLTAFEHPNDAPATQQGDVGDTFLNYRYQLLADDDFLWVAPRFSLILPTGDERFGLGTGQLGYQFNLPISRYGERFDFHFNAGFTYVPNVSVALAEGGKSPGQDIRGYNLGASAFWKPETYLHFFVEFLGLRNEEFDDLGFRDGIHQVFVNPGVRYAVIQEEVEWVLGMATPIGLTRDSPHFGVFAYMSVEHGFRKTETGSAE